jgi:hypothetical protein
MVIGTSRCAHVLCYLFCWRVSRARRETRHTRSPLIHPVLRRSLTLARTLAAGSLAVCTSEGDAAMHPAPEDYLLSQRSRRNYRSQSTQPPLEAVRRPTLASGNRHMSAPVHRCVDARRPKSRAGSRLSLPTLNWWSEPPAGPSEQGCDGVGARGHVRRDVPESERPSRAFWPSLPMAPLSGPSA